MAEVTLLTTLALCIILFCIIYIKICALFSNYFQDHCQNDNTTAIWYALLY